MTIVVDAENWNSKVICSEKRTNILYCDKDNSIPGYIIFHVNIKEGLNTEWSCWYLNNENFIFLENSSL